MLWDGDVKLSCGNAKRSCKNSKRSYKNAKRPFVHVKRPFLCVKRPFIFGNFGAVQHKKNVHHPWGLRKLFVHWGFGNVPRRYSLFLRSNVLHGMLSFDSSETMQERPVVHTLDSSSVYPTQETFFWLHLVGLEPARCTLRVYLMPCL